jgi:hypothetical protein
VCVLDILGCVLDVGGGGEGWVFACLPFCHAWFLGGFHWFSVSFAPWLREVCKVADGSVVWFWVFGWGSLRGVVRLSLVFLGRLICRGVFYPRFWGWAGGFLGQNPNLVFAVLSVPVCWL